MPPARDELNDTKRDSEVRFYAGLSGKNTRLALIDPGLAFASLEASAPDEFSELQVTGVLSRSMIYPHLNVHFASLVAYSSTFGPRIIPDAKLKMSDRPMPVHYRLTDRHGHDTVGQEQPPSNP